MIFQKGGWIQHSVPLNSACSELYNMLVTKVGQSNKAFFFQDLPEYIPAAWSSYIAHNVITNEFIS